MNESNIVVYLVLGVLISSLSLIVIWLAIERRVRSRRRRAIHQVHQLRRIAAESRRRLAKIESHAIDYFNSLSPEATQALNLIRRVIPALEYRISELQQLLRAPDEMSLSTAEDLIASKLSDFQNSLYVVVDSAPLPTIFPLECHTRLEHLLQTLGKEISRISSQKHKSNPLPNHRRATYLDLLDAGIRFVGEAGRKMTRSFKSPFRNTEEPEQPRTHQ